MSSSPSLAIVREADTTRVGEPIDPVIAYGDQSGPSRVKLDDRFSEDALRELMERDHFPLPSTKDREAYYGNNHLEYWLSGLKDYLSTKDVADELDVRIDSLFDLGCCSGRVLRHFLVNDDAVEVYGADINLRYVLWLVHHLSSSRSRYFQNSTLPHLPMADDSVSLFTAFSVFTHIDVFDIAWIMEIRRVLKPGGLAYLTANTDHSLMNARKQWPLYNNLSQRKDFDETLFGTEMKQDKHIFKFQEDGASASIVILHSNYIKAAWGQILELKEIKRQYHGTQDVVLLQKPSS